MKALLSRVTKELKNWQKLPYITKPTFCPDSLQVRSEISGPPSSPYEGRMFKVCINLTYVSRLVATVNTISPQFPFEAPSVVIESAIYHLNIDQNGMACLPFLSEWVPTISFQDIFHSVYSLLGEPVVSNAVDTARLLQYNTNRQVYLQKAKETK